jgi:outer membrane protein
MQKTYMMINTKILDVKKAAVVLMCCGFTSLLPQVSLGQDTTLVPVRLSLGEMLALVEKRSLRVRSAVTEEKAAKAEVSDARNMMLPLINSTSTYQRYSKLTLYENGLGQARSINRQPSANGASLATELNFNLYAGGKTRALIHQQQVKSEIATIDVHQATGDVSLQLIYYYLELHKLFQEQGLIGEQLKRAETRLKTINALFNNQRVTRSDVLRAQLMLSNTHLDKDRNQNDMTIANHKINALLDLPSGSRVIPDLVITSKPTEQELSTLAASRDHLGYPVQRNTAILKLYQTRLGEVQAANRPSISLISAYGFSYPNYLFFPPVDQMYSIGYVGLKLSYNISSLYHNKHKIMATRLRILEASQNKDQAENDVNEQVGGFLIKYEEALNRVEVKKQSIKQAEVNYRIVNTKYFNQLALLTDLLDADNLYQEARYDLINSEAEAVLIYYKLLYAKGKL